MHLRLWAVGLVSLLMLAVPAAAQASIGVGIQAGPVRLTGAAHPGGSYALPPVYVINTGTQDESLSIRIERLSAGAGRAVPAAWIRPGAAVQLSHNQSARIPLELVVPGAARPGQYLTDVVVKGSAALSGGGANLDVAAATKLEFRVAPGAVSGSWFAVPSWLWPGIGIVLLIAAAAALARKFGLRVQIDRGPADAAVVRAGRGDDGA
jgi:hypothetical protein